MVVFSTIFVADTKIIFVYDFEAPLIYKNHFKKQKYGQSLFKKHSKFQNYDEIFYCGMTRLRNTNLDAYIQGQHTRPILKTKNMGQSLIKKRSKFLNFDKIFYCGMTILTNMISNYCGLCRYVKAIKPMKTLRLFKNHLTFQNFNIQ